MAEATRPVPPLPPATSGAPPQATMPLVRQGCLAAAAVAWALASCAVAAWALVGCAAPAGGGLRGSASRGRGDSSPRRLSVGAGEKLKGLEYVISGYDIFLGNPDPTRGAVDKGFRNRVFKANYGSELSPDGTALPEGITALQCQGSCSLATQVQEIMSMEDYYDFLSTSVYTDIEFGDIARFQASADFQRVLEGFQSRENVYTIVTAHCCAYEAFVQTFKPPPADENFLAAVDMAPVEYDPDFYFDIIGEFGTHFLSTVQLGAMYGEETQFTKVQYDNMKASKSDWWVEAQASFIVSIKAGVASSTEMTSRAFFEEYSTNTLQYSLGALPPQSGDPGQWLTDTIKNPVPTSMELKPLSELFASSIVVSETNMTKLKAKKENMERALHEYCPDKLLKEGKVDSCTKNVYDPDGTAVEKTCLAKVWGGGGQNGQSFDDSATMVELHGLFTNLQVKQIEYRSGRWMDSIQLVLALGNDNWPLPEHGGKGGVPGTMTFSDGQKIIAVELTYERYIDKISFWTDDGIQQVVGGPGGLYTKMVNFKDAVGNATGYFPRSAWLVGLYGHSQDYVDSLGFYVAYTCSSSEVPGPAGLPLTRLASVPNQTASSTATAVPPA